MVTDPAGRGVAASDVLQPGARTRLGPYFEPGRYVFTCRIVAQAPDGQIVDHFARGMSITVDVMN